ncbi:MAG: glycoside hydrolase family 3 protein [Sphingobacteriaceae bacterium]|nr:glycoside hydrolase family 3 protein [Sphingobacteriaceae bacterium]
MKSKYLSIVSFLLLATSFSAEAQQKSYIESLNDNPKWVDSVFNTLSKKQKIAQLFFVRAKTNQDKNYEDSLVKVIKKQKLGGVVFFQGGPGRQVALTNRFQEISKTPLIISSDGEWGLGMRLDSAISFPYQMALGAIQNNQLIYKMGLAVAKDYKRMGMHLNLAPDVDINNNANNPVINYRSFGENKFNVAEKGTAYLKGMQDGGLLVSIKHFPGHGDTDVDSHYDLPKLPFSKSRLDSLEMYPFKELIKKGAAGVMVAHMNIPQLDTTANLPSTLSKIIVTDILKRDLNFKGLIISDAMDMKGVVKFFPEGTADVMALKAGNDILELSEDSKRAIKLVKKAIRKDEISIERIDESVKKVLKAKYWAGLHKNKRTNESNVYEEVNSAESLTLRQELADASMTILRGKDYIKSLNPNEKTVIVSLGVADTTLFQTELRQYFRNSTIFSLDNKSTTADFDKILMEMGSKTQLIVGIHDNRSRPANKLTFNAEILNFIEQKSRKNTVFALFANPYNLVNLKGIENSKALLIAYQKEEFMQKAAARAFKNELEATGKMPVSVGSIFKYGDGG